MPLPKWVVFNIETQLTRNLRFYVSGDNLFILTKYSGYDPEFSTLAGASQMTSSGIDFANFPRARTYTFGLTVGL